MNNVILLKEAMGTKYIINSLSGLFNTICNKCEQESDTLDLADCKFGPECAHILTNYYGKVNIINSKDSDLDYILKNNAEVVGQVTSEYEKFPMPIDSDITIDWILSQMQSLPRNAKYTVRIALYSIKQKAAIVLLIMARPDIEFDIRQCASEIFDFVRETWIASAESHNKYYELIVPNTISREYIMVNDARMFGAIDYGYKPEKEFIGDRKVLPFEFGNSQLTGFEGNKPSEEWLPVLKKCLKVFETEGSIKRVAGCTTKNFLNFRGDYIDE